MLEYQLMAQACHAEQQQRMVCGSHGNERKLNTSRRSSLLVRQLFSPLNRILFAGVLVGTSFGGVVAPAEAANFSQGQESLQDGPNNRNRNHDKNEEDDRNKDERKKSKQKRETINNNGNDNESFGSIPPKGESCPQIIPGNNPIRDNQSSTIYCEEGPKNIPPKAEFCPVNVPPFVLDGQPIVCEPSPVFPPKEEPKNCIQQQRVTGLFNPRTGETLIFPSPCPN